MLGAHSKTLVSMSMFDMLRRIKEAALRGCAPVRGAYILGHQYEFVSAQARDKVRLPAIYCRNRSPIVRNTWSPVSVTDLIIDAFEAIKDQIQHHRRGIGPPLRAAQPGSYAVSQCAAGWQAGSRVMHGHGFERVLRPLLQRLGATLLHLFFPVLLMGSRRADQVCLGFFFAV